MAVLTKPLTKPLAKTTNKKSVKTTKNNTQNNNQINNNNNLQNQPEITSEQNKNPVSFQLKGRMFTLSVLQIQSLDLKQIDKELEDKIKLAPKFFKHTPVVIDVSDTPAETDFLALKQTIEKHGLIPVGVKGTNTSNCEDAQKAGLAIMTDNNSNNKNSNKSNTQSSNKSTSNSSQTIINNNQQGEHEISKPHSRLITQPIRSGQQVYSPGDLIIVSSVSPGAELLAEGSIHVYGTLRGRALAGINGLKSARIFCNHLEAELVSIAGQYKIFEDIQEHTDQTPKQLYLDDTQLIISSL